MVLSAISALVIVELKVSGNMVKSDLLNSFLEMLTSTVNGDSFTNRQSFK